MIKYVRESDVVGERTPPPHKRVLKHLVAPWTMGSKNLWVGVTIVDPDSSSNPHSHSNLEEVFYVLSGQGEIKVGNEVMNIEPGTCIYIPINTMHQLINKGSKKLKVLACTSPPFVYKKFRQDHELNKHGGKLF